jgi:hypothetical protein
MSFHSHICNRLALKTASRYTIPLTTTIDYKTDAVIQSSLRNELGGDVTLLTVAHRLQTIMDSDKIVRDIWLHYQLRFLIGHIFLDGS